MARIGNFDDHGIDHRHVGSDRNAIVEETRVLEFAVRTVNVFLVERPADALHRAALELTLDVGGMDRLTGILQHGVAQHGDPAGLAVDLDVDQMGAEAGTRPLRVDLGVADDRPAGLAGHRGDFGERHGLEVAGIGAGRPGVTVLPFHRVGGDFPDLGGPLAELLDHVARRIDRRHAARESRAAAAG